MVKQPAVRGVRAPVSAPLLTWLNMSDPGANSAISEAQEPELSLWSTRAAHQPTIGQLTAECSLRRL